MTNRQTGIQMDRQAKKWTLSTLDHNRLRYQQNYAKAAELQNVTSKDLPLVEVKDPDTRNVENREESQ